MIEYRDLLGKTFRLGSQDCYEVIRAFYRINYQIQLPNYARPAEFWRHGMELYRDRYIRHGFQTLDCHPSQYQIGDVVLMSIRSTVANHAGVLVERGQLLHHFTGRLSEVVAYRGVWRNSTVAVMRHKDVLPNTMEVKSDLLDLLSPHVRRKIENELKNHGAAG